MNIAAGLDWLTGPILDKELRVSSRRRRNYWLRVAYIGLLMIPLAVVFQENVRFSTRQANTVAQLSEAGLALTATIVWFQFIAAQLIACVMLSTSISDEITHRTLGVLMTTPIRSFQIVSGKLLSKLCQLLLIIGISLPLLAIIRVFGGVPWGFVWTSLAITLTATLFAGTLTLLFSVWGRHAYGVIVRAVVTLGVLYLLLPMVIAAGLQYLVGNNANPVMSRFVSLIGLVNPLVALQFQTIELLSPGSTAGVVGSISWWSHCCCMLGFSAVLMFGAVLTVRRVALEQITGQLVIDRKKGRRSKTHVKKETSPLPPHQSLRPVRGDPVVWKEVRTPFIKGGKRTKAIALIVTVLALILIYGINAWQGHLRQDFFHTTSVIILLTMGLVSTVILSATTITREKEAQSWPLLLTTPLTNTQILMGKAIGSFRQGLPIWIILAGHLLVFVVLGYIHPLALIQVALIVFSAVFLMSGTGLYFSARFRKTTSAVVANLGVALFLWAIVPLLVGALADWSNRDERLHYYFTGHPFVQTSVVITATGGRENARTKTASLLYDWSLPDDAGRGPWAATGLLLCNGTLYLGVGAFCAWRATTRVRRDIF